MQIDSGDRVQTHKWAPELYTGTVTRVDDDGETIYVKWDGASFTEQEMDLADVEVIPGSGDPSAPYAIFTTGDPGQ